jgi:CheY-like chemotaxis protein
MPRILLIEDDSEFRHMTAQLLAHHGFEVVEAENGRVGLQKYLATPIDLVVCDLVMPEMEGEETIMRLRKLDPAVKIVAMSGSTDNASLYLRIAAMLGAQGTLKKPFAAHVLLHAVNHLLDSPIAPAANCDFACQSG